MPTLQSCGQLIAVIKGAHIAIIAHKAPSLDLNVIHVSIDSLTALNWIIKPLNQTIQLYMKKIWKIIRSREEI